MIFVHPDDRRKKIMGQKKKRKKNQKQKSKRESFIEVQQRQQLDIDNSSLQTGIPTGSKQSIT